MKPGKRNALSSTLPWLLFAATASAGETATIYEISATLGRGGETIAMPSVHARSGEAALLSVAGENGYRLMVHATATGSNAIDVRVEAGTSHASLETVVTMLPDKPLQVSTGDLALSITITPGAP